MSSAHAPFPAPTTWPAPAKLNLFLHITGRRPDGYHELQTLFQFLDYGDELTIAVNDSGDIRLSPAIEGVAVTDNLIYRAARLLQQHSGCRLGADISLHKILPMGAGLGGGSSNAATALVALNYLWQLGLDNDTLAELGLSLGADVPIFVRGFAAFAEGVGERLQPVNPPEPWYLVIWPGVAVDTGKIFQDPELTRDTPVIGLADLATAELGNDCQEVTKKRHPEVAKALAWLIEYAPSKMTGTGSCVFGAFPNRQAAVDALAKLPSPMQGFVAKGINRSPLADRLDAIR